MDIEALWHTIYLNHTQRQKNIREWRKVYSDKYVREPAFDGGSNLQIPVTAWVTDIIHDRLFLSQFGVNSPLIRVKAKKLDDTAIANSLEEVLKYYQTETKKAHAVSLAMLDAILLGCGVVRVSWKKEKQKWGRVRTRRYPKTEWVPLENFFLLNPYAELSAQGAVAQQYFKRKGELLKLADDGLFDRDVVETLSHSLERPYTVSSEEDATQIATEEHHDNVKLVDIFYRENEEWRYAIYAPDSNVVLYDEEYNYPISAPPFFLLRFVPTGYGRGVASILQPLEEELSILHNQRVDNNTLINLPVFKVLTSSPALRDKEAWFAGKKIPVDTPEDITPMQITEKVTPLQDELQLFNYIKLFSGVSELMSGNPLRGEKTAFEVEASLAEGSVRFRRNIQFVVEWLREQALFELLLLKQYGDDAEIMRIVSGISDVPHNPFDLIEPEDLFHRFIVEGNTILTNKEMERQKWFLLRNILSQEQAIVTNPIAWYEVLRQLLIAYDVDYRSIIGEKPTPEELAPPPQPPPLPIEQLAALGNAGIGGEQINPAVLQHLQTITGGEA